MYPYLNKADDQPINGNPQTPAFKCQVRYPEDEIGEVTILGAEPTGETLKELIDRLVDESWDALYEDIPAKYKKKAQKVYPYEEDVDDAGDPTGTITFRFKQNETIKVNGEVRKVKIGIFDAKRKEVKKMVATGSEGKIRFTTRNYGMVQGKDYIVGITLDFNAAQVLKLEEYGGSNANGFGEEEGYSDDEYDSDDVDNNHQEDDDDAEDDDF
jgi:hypothetical protein